MSLLLLATPPPSDRVRMSSSAEIMTTFFMCRMGRIVYSSVCIVAHRFARLAFGCTSP